MHIQMGGWFGCIKATLSKFIYNADIDDNKMLFVVR